MHLAPAVKRLYSRKPIEAPIEELTLKLETEIDSDIILPSIPNSLIELPVEELELIFELPGTEPLSFKAEFENLNNCPAQYKYKQNFLFITKKRG